jgi:hypothetical protein
MDFNSGLPLWELLEGPSESGLVLNAELRSLVPHDFLCDWGAAEKI